MWRSSRAPNASDSCRTGPEIAVSWKLILANFGLWSAMPPEDQGLGAAGAARTLAAIADAWHHDHPDLVLPKGALVSRVGP